MLEAVGFLLGLGIILAVIFLFMTVMRLIARREKAELEQIIGEQHHA